MSGLSSSAAQRVREQLLQLQKEFIGALPAKLENIERLWLEYRSDRAEPPGRELLAAIHKLAGTSTMYGLGDLGQRARELEGELEDELDGIQDIPDRTTFEEGMAFLMSQKSRPAH